MGCIVGGLSELDSTLRRSRASGRAAPRVDPMEILARQDLAVLDGRGERLIRKRLLVADVVNATSAVSE